MQSTVDGFQLTIEYIFRYGRTMFPNSQVIDYSNSTRRKSTFREVASESDRLAAGLRALGVGRGDRVATLGWNTREHLAAYFAIPRIAAVLHTLNLRLSHEQLKHVINHGHDKIIIVDAGLVSQLETIIDSLTTVEWIIVMGTEEDAVRFGSRGISYDSVLATGSDLGELPDVDENSAATLCYTSGTTGLPRGVAYSHRSVFLHSLASCSGNAFVLNEHDQILMLVPMFHANAWGLPYSGWLVGADLILPGRNLDPQSLSSIFRQDRPTFTAAVPTLYNDLHRYSVANGVDLSSLRMAVCGGAAVSSDLVKKYRDVHGVSIVQGWGMTETGPLASLSHPPKGTHPDEDTFWRIKSGRPIHGVEVRAVDSEGADLPWDGESVGQIEVRGFWVSNRYYLDDSANDPNGWLKTGDVGSIDERGYIQITDRTKDVIKSGGEWISSIALEEALCSHNAVKEAAVIAVPDSRWDERPLAIVVLEEDSDDVDKHELASYLRNQVPRWWVPERWVFASSLPRTSVGKYDKVRLRDEYRTKHL
ncbi:long-chain-fatty-acid--CoA ligase (plasmid) [Rhodococcus opacus]|uniref:long-chain-fatty-acid--CoA ligase n=1 Tax=Rhodococcus opacus TaxID=37919 RepID=UPI0034D30A11